MLKRKCSICGKECIFKSRVAQRYAERNNTSCRNCALKYKYPNKKLGSGKRLNEESYESYYWLGLLCADGHFNNGRVSLSLIDKDLVEKFAKFLEIEKIKENKPKSQKHSVQYSVSLMDKDNIIPLMNKYNITSNKTYNPINFDAIKGIRNKLCFIAGFIDGDGCIGNLQNRPDFNLRIKIHNSWEEVLRKINKIILREDKISFTKKGYVVFCTGDSRVLKKLKRVVLKFNLPLLKRKWDIIDLNFIGKYEQAELNKNLIIQLLNEKKKYKDIKKITGLSTGLISKIKNKL